MVGWLVGGLVGCWVGMYVCMHVGMYVCMYVVSRTKALDAWQWPADYHCNSGFALVRLSLGT